MCENSQHKHQGHITGVPGSYSMIGFNQFSVYFFEGCYGDLTAINENHIKACKLHYRSQP